MTLICFEEDKIIDRQKIERPLKVDEKQKGRLAVGVDFVRDYDSETEVIEIIRRNKRGP